VNSLETTQYFLISGFIVGIFYVFAFTYYYIVRYKNEQKRRFLLERLIAAAQEP
jgi:hypothetical protein